MPKDEEFFVVPLNSYEPTACSPPEPKEPEWRGIIIQAPKIVKFTRGIKVDEFGAFAKIPVCAFDKFDVPSSPIDEDIMLHAVDRSTGADFSGRLIDLDESPSEPVTPPPGLEPPPEPEQADATGMVASGYYNINLADYVELPEKSAAYDVYLEFRGYRSNVVTIELIEEEPRNAIE